MRDELLKIYEVVLEQEVDHLAESEDFETIENYAILEYLESLTNQVREVYIAQLKEDEIESKAVLKESE